MFDEVRFPDDIAYGAIGGPEFFTAISMSLNGEEQRNINWQQARARYNVSYGIKSEEQLQNLIAFFCARHGRAIGFRFKDWVDFSAKNEIVYDKKQLTKTYKSNNRSYIRVITKPVLGTVELHVNSQKYTGNFNVDYSTGRIFFDEVPEGILTSSFEFDVPVRFDADYLATSIDDHKTFSCKNIQLIEIKL